MARGWLSAQQQILGVSSCSIVGYSHCSPNSGYLECPVGGMIICLPNGRFSGWLPIGYLDVLNCRTSGEGLQAWTTDGHPPNRDCDHVHIGYSHKFIFNDMAGAHASDPWGCHQFHGHEADWWFKIHFYQFGNM